MRETDLPNDINALKSQLLKAQKQLFVNNQLITQQQEKLTINQKLISKQQEQLTINKLHIESLEDAIKIFLAKKFGSSSERWEGQPLLFNEAEESSKEAEKAEESSSNVKGHKRKKPGRKPLPPHIPREQVYYQLLGADRNCECGTEMREVGETKSETLKVIPAQLKILELIRKKYVCPCCEGKFKTAPMPKQPIPRSIASPSLLAHVATSKFVDGLPLYRQEEILRRIGIDLPRSSLANWMIKIGKLVIPLTNLIKERILESMVMTMDETHIQVLKEKGRKAQSKSFMWVMVGLDPKKTAVIFEYSPSRSAEVALGLLEGFKGTLVSDGYAGYKSVASSLDIRHAGCWDHSRRYFEKAAKTLKSGGLAAEGLQYIQMLYSVERRYKASGPKQLYIARNLYTRSILRHLRQWLDRNINKIPPKSGTGKALNYLFNEWNNLVVFLEDGHIPISNEKAENAIRPFVIGRKAWLFSASTQGAHASAAIYSLVETAKANGIEPHAYLERIFTDLPNVSTIEEIENLLPWSNSMRIYLKGK